MSLYFHILASEEIEALRRPLSILADHLEELLEEWFVLYRKRFPEDPALSQDEMAGLYGQDLQELFGSLLEVDMDRFAAAERSAGTRLARAVSYAEVVAMLHLFEESCARVLERRSPSMLPADTYLVLDKISHCRMILFADAYFESKDRTVVRDAGKTSRVATTESIHGIVGTSDSMRRVLDQAQAAAKGSGSILIAGESGTGKELLARAIHAFGGDPRRPFVPVNCAALPPELIESELFGHRKGSFSGAREEYLGLIRAADGGTLFLDEITEMAQQTQAKLLRVLQERLVRPVGSTREVPVEVRVVASSNRVPARAVEEGLLRKDLYYRLQTYVISVPPLREHPQDIPLLARHFIALCNERQKRDVEGVHEAAMQLMMSYPWPGNVRELYNTIERAFTFGLGRWISSLDLPEEVLQATTRVGSSSARGGEAAAVPPRAGNRSEAILTVAEAEREALLRALESVGGNKLRAAQVLGISRHGLYSKLRKFGLA